MEPPRASTTERRLLAQGRILEALIDGSTVESVEVILDITSGVDGLDENEYEETVDEYYEKFQAVVAAASKFLGKPSFCNGAAASGFPEDQEAEWLALWTRPYGRFMVQQRHEDRELPFTVSVVIQP